MDRDQEFVINSGGVELLDETAGLWEQLKSHHVSHSPHFGEVYARKTFAQRKEGLLAQGTGGLHVILVRSSGVVVGYCISTVSSDSIGEIDSLFVSPEYRGQGLADSLMKMSMAWLQDENVRRVRLSVAAGNEQVFGFYARYGLFPAKIILEQMPQ